MTAGCHHAGTVPPGWQGKPLISESLPGPSQTVPDTGPQGNGSGPPAILQVVICYGKTLSNHTALRLEAPGVQTLMWDPGGTYKQDDPAYERRYDVLTRNAPTIQQWWLYRRDRCREPVMEVFQWSIIPDQARRLHTILLTRHDPDDPAQLFEPDAGGLECCKRVSEFLSRFADDRPAVSTRYFWPHKLGEHLWTQQPDRVIVYRKEGPNMVYTRLPNSPGLK